jgi:hypothetical protein
LNLEDLQMRRRELIAGLSGAAVWPLVVRAQQSDRVSRIGVVMPYWPLMPASLEQFTPDGKAT